MTLQQVQLMTNAFQKLSESARATGTALIGLRQVYRRHTADILRRWHKRYRRHYWMGRQTGMRPGDAMEATALKFRLD